MGLREQATADLRTILEDVDTGFGWEITLRHPDGQQAELKGTSTDVHQAIDPETGMLVSGRRASVALPVAALEEVAFEMPRGVADSSSKPWVVELHDAMGHPHTFKVTEALPDRALGVVVCILEAYKP